MLFFQFSRKIAAKIQIHLDLKVRAIQSYTAVEEWDGIMGTWGMIISWKEKLPYLYSSSTLAICDLCPCRYLSLIFLCKDVAWTPWLDGVAMAMTPQYPWVRALLQRWIQQGTGCPSEGPGQDICLKLDRSISAKVLTVTVVCPNMCFNVHGAILFLQMQLAPAHSG